MEQKSTVDKRNNFDFLRFFFASLVIVSHSYPLLGKNDDEPYALLTKTESFGGLAVSSFFIISGYLIFISLKNSKSIVDYVWKRLVRLFPGLFVMLVITLLIVPFVYEVVYEGSNIFGERTYWTYLPMNLTLFDLQYNIKGVFDRNPFNRGINGSLWTLAYEFTMYIALVSLFFIRKKKVVLSILILLFCFSYYFYGFHDTFFVKIFKKINIETGFLYKLSTYFLAGSVLAAANIRKWKGLNYILIISCMAFVLAITLGIYRYAVPLCLPFIIIILGNKNTKFIGGMSEKIGDLSYGIYIYAFLIQQLIVYWFLPSVWVLTVSSFCVTSMFAYLSWRFVENKALKYKNLF